MKPLYSLVLVAAVWALAGLAAQAQPGSGGPGPSSAPSEVPIDGGASLLLAGGAAYALRRLRRTGRPPQAR